jgi:hypothetical protein
VRDEAKVRSFRDALRVALTRTCGCAAAGHAAECDKGRSLIGQTLRTLDWVLGDDDMDGLVDRMITAAAL